MFEYVSMSFEEFKETTVARFSTECDGTFMNTLKFQFSSKIIG
jgi:hypothetical protein